MAVGRAAGLIASLGAAMTVMTGAAFPGLDRASPHTSPARDPWTAAQVMTPEQLARQLSDPKAPRALVVCVGFRFLYDGAHDGTATKRSCFTAGAARGASARTSGRRFESSARCASRGSRSCRLTTVLRAIGWRKAFRPKRVARERAMPIARFTAGPISACSHGPKGDIGAALVSSGRKK